MTRDQLYHAFGFPEKLSPRLRGFYYGYRFEVSSSEQDHLDPEFTRGWFEGMDLLFDERRAGKKK